MGIRTRQLFNYRQYDLRLAAELLALGAGKLRPQLSLLLAVLAVLTSVHPLPLGLTGPWLAYAVLCTLAGLAFRRRYRHADRDGLTRPQLRRAEWLGLGYSASVGLLWGGCGWLLVPGAADHNLIITMIYLGVCAGAGSIAIFGLAHLLVGSLVSATLFIGSFPAIFPQHWPGLTVLFVLYHFVIVGMARERNQTIVANMQLRDDKARLLELQQQEVRKVQQASLDKSAFLAAASHDLRQPVHALMLLGHALRLRLPAGAEAALVERMLEAGQALSEQFNHLMDLSRLEGGAYRLVPGPVELEAFMHRLVGTQRQVAAGQGQTVRLRLDRRLRDQAVQTDSGLLGRILDNLIANALKFAPAGAGVLVTVRLGRHGVRFDVLDQGPGIPADQFEQVFKPYVQLHNPTRDRSRGIGLGLSIVQEAAALLGAELRLRSTLGRGSRFTLALSAALMPLPASSPFPVSAAPVAATRLQGRRLLLVEDDPMAAAALRTWAEGWGLVVTHHADPGVVDGETAMPDLILCDIRLPGPRDGIDCLSAWLEQWPRARGLLVSGELLPDVHERVEQEGLLMLSKPVDPDLLLRTLAGLLGQHPPAEGHTLVQDGPIMPA